MTPTSGCAAQSPRSGPNAATDVMQYVSRRGDLAMTELVTIDLTMADQGATCQSRALKY